MSDKFLLIAITPEEFIDGEGDIIEKILASGVDYVHIRKPHSTADRVSILLSQINPENLQRIKLHDHFELAKQFLIGGVHLNSRNPMAPSGNLKISRSCHSINEIEVCKTDQHNYEYLTLSPIFDSISKKGYVSAFNLEDLSDKIADKNVIALGGVKPSDFSKLKKAGFGGAAMLGCVWDNPDEFCRKL